MKHLFKFSLIFLLAIFSCKKEKDNDNIIGSIDISDANSLLIGSVKSGIFVSNDLSDSIKLFKQTIADEIHPVIFFNSGGGDMGNAFVPDGIYTLNSTSFLLNVYRKGDVTQKIQSYIVNKVDGKAYLLKEAVISEVYMNDEWIKGYPYGGFITTNANTFIIPDGEKLVKLSLNPDGTGLTSVILLNNPVFDADTAGNVISGNTIELVDKSSITVSEINEKSLVVKNYNSGFYLVKQEEDSIKIQTIILGMNDYSLKNTYKIAQNSSEWKYLGNTSIRKIKASLIIFDKAILFIDSTEAKLMSFSTLSLQSISSFYVTDEALFITGKNVLNKEVFLKINPKLNPATFTHVFAPDSYKCYFVQMSPEGGFSFYAGKINSTKDVIGFHSSMQITSILDNDYNIKVKQVLPLK